jgi:hypothetical protein
MLKGAPPFTNIHRAAWEGWDGILLYRKRLSRL